MEKIHSALRCHIDSSPYYINIVGNHPQTNDKNLCSIDLYHEDDDANLLAAKSFVWPEKCLPKQVSYDSEQQFISLKGEFHCIRIPLRLDRLRNVQPESSISQPLIHASFSSAQPSEMEDMDRFIALLRSVMIGSDVNESLEDIYDIISSNPTIGRFISISFTLKEDEQLKLIDAIVEWGGAKCSPMIFELRKWQIFNEFSAIKKLIDYFSMRNDSDMLERFVVEFDILNDALYAQYLHIVALNRDRKFRLSILRSLIVKPYTREILIKHIKRDMENLDVADLVDDLTYLLKDAEFLSYSSQTAELLSLLLDCFFEKLIWDEKCHERFKRAAHTISEYVKSLDLLSINHHRLLEYKKTWKDGERPFSDYYVQRIKFKEERLCP